jgi:guanylate cyclase
VAVADLPGDDDDTLLRKRVGVTAGYLTVVAPLTLPLQTGLDVWSVALGVGMSTYALANLALLARSRRFERYVVALVGAGLVFVPLAMALGGGITGSSPGLVWGFLVPAYAIMALGPGRAIRWFVAYLVMVAVAVLLDPWARSAFGPAPYALQLLGQVQDVVVPVTITFLLLRYTDVRRRAAEARVEELLSNAIPSSIVTRLRHGERRIADAYPETSVLFADIQGFTSWAQRTPPERVVALLDALFSRFDALTTAHGLEKIKTIGDAYMAVAGAPRPHPDHAGAAVGLGRAMLRAVHDWRAEHGLDLPVRVGVASGTVVGGVIGNERLLFDLWGDTVNLAQRIESSGVPDRVQVAQATRDLLAGRLDFEPRTVELKGLGTLTAYLVVEDPSAT